MAGSSDDFWERLIVGWVGVGVAAFVAQGLWFGIASLLGSHWPRLEPGLRAASGRLGVPWGVAILVGLGWTFGKAWSVRGGRSGRR